MMNNGLKDDKLIRLSTLAEITGISVHCIRTYVDQGLIQISDRTTGGAGINSLILCLGTGCSIQVALKTYEGIGLQNSFSSFPL